MVSVQFKYDHISCFAKLSDNSPNIEINHHMYGSFLWTEVLLNITRSGSTAACSSRSSTELLVFWKFSSAVRWVYQEAFLAHAMVRFLIVSRIFS